MRYHLRRAVPVVLLLLIAAIIGCSGPKKPELTYPGTRSDTQLPTGVGTITRVDRPLQANGERERAGRPTIRPALFRFLRERVFWTGSGGVRIELPPQQRGDDMRFLWINPVNLTPKTRYGSDVTLITDGSAGHYSLRDIEYVNDGHTTLVTPEGCRLVTRQGVHRTYLSGGGQVVELAPRQTTAVDGIRIETTRAWADNVEGQDRSRHHVGYILFIDEDGDGRKDLTIWYVGPYSEGEARPDNPELIAFNNVTDPALLSGRLPSYPVDIMIVQINSPCTLNPRAIVDLAGKVNAGVVMPVGQSLTTEADRDTLLALDAACNRPLWFPPAPE